MKYINLAFLETIKLLCAYGLNSYQYQSCNPNCKNNEKPNLTNVQVRLAAQFVTGLYYTWGDIETCITAFNGKQSYNP